MELRMGSDLAAKHDGGVVRTGSARPAGQLWQHHPA
jgi:hypothetical protein